MTRKLVTKLAGIMCAAVAAGAFLAPAAQATPITFYNNAGNQTGATFTINCGTATGDCAGLLQAVSNNSTPPGWSSTIGQMLAISAHGNSPATETSFVNGLLGTTLTASSGNINNPSGETANFTTGADYFMLKIGNKNDLPFAVLQNISGGSLKIYFSSFSGMGSGLSHYITFDGTAAGGNGGNGGNGGTVTDVPEPGVLGLFGLGLLLAGLGYRLRRRDPA